MKRVLSEFKALGKKELRKLAIKVLLLRLLYIPYLVLLLPVLVLYMLSNLFKSMGNKIYFTSIPFQNLEAAIDKQYKLAEKARKK